VSQDYSNGMDAEKLSDDEHDLGSDAELEYDEELNQDVNELTGELDDDDDGVDDVDLNTDLTDVN